MTVLQVVKGECDNCDGAGNCVGIGIRDDLSLYRFRSEGKCWLAPDAEENIERCTHFEECIAPLAQSRMRAAVTQEQKLAAARRAKGGTPMKWPSCQPQQLSMLNAGVAEET